MKHVPNIVGGLLGLAFIAFALMFFLKVDMGAKPPPEGSPPALFMGAFVPTGYLTAVKICELIGGILCAIPLTRNIGLLFLGPIILNILAFHGLVAKEGLFSPPLILICVLAAYLLWSARTKFAGLLNR